MMRLFPRQLRSGLPLAVYVVCTALVFSFILFEVLDIDGSDFPGRPAAAAAPAALSEASHDIRRALLQGPANTSLDARIPRADGAWHPVQCHHLPLAWPSATGPSRPHAPRAALPRSALPDPPPPTDQPGSSVTAR